MMRREAGNYPASVNEDNWPRLFRRLSGECGFTADQVDQLIFTQISKPSAMSSATNSHPGLDAEDATPNGFG
jgi:3-oxoacyl-[acyl-carrier-protein] synthase-3